MHIFDKPVVCVTKNGNIVTFKTNRGKESTWLWHVEKYNVKYWCFASVIIPVE